MAVDFENETIEEMDIRLWGRTAKSYINYNDNFEDAYLRHEYIKKCDHLHGKFVYEYRNVVNATAKFMYHKLYPNYVKVGFDKDDIINITNMYMLSYMGIYSLRFNDEAKKKFVDKFTQHFGHPPSDKTIYNKDKSKMISFLKQRLQHCSTVCGRKARNITVGLDKRHFFAYTAHSTPASHGEILEKYKKLGYRKITKAEYRECVKKTKKLKEQTITDQDGFKVIDIQILNNGISYDEYKIWTHQNKTPYSNATPEEILESIESEQQINKYKKIFTEMSPSTKHKKLTRFINDNKNNKFLKKELALARKMIKNMV